MALLWMDGFDSYGPNTTPNDGHDDTAFDQLVSSSGYVFASGIGVIDDTRTGYGKSLWCSTTSGVGRENADVRYAFLPKAEIVVGAAFKYRPTNLAKIFSFMFDDRLGTVTSQMIVYANAEGGISLSIDGGDTLLAASGPNIVFPSVWQFIEVKYRPNKTAGEITIKVDGQTCLTYQGPTSPMTTPNEVNMVRLASGGEYSLAFAPCTKWYDDLYILDTLGSGFNDFLGDVVVHSVNVVSDQGPNELQQFGGETGHFTAVDDWPPDGDVSYLYTNTAGETELFNLDALPENIIDVLAVSVHIRGKKDAPGQSAVQCVAKFDTDQVTGAAQPLAVQYVTKNLFLEQCPDGTAWTKEKAEATKIGFKSA